MRNRAFCTTIVVVQNVVQVPWLPEVNRRSRDPEGDPLGCAHVQPEVAQYPP